MNFHQISFIYITKYFVIQLIIPGLPTLHEADFSQKKIFFEGLRNLLDCLVGR